MYLKKPFVLFACSILMFSCAATVHAEAVYNQYKVKPAFDAARSARVDFVGIGDSNQIKDGTGWDHGFQFALENKYGLYATQLISVNENSGFGAGAGYTYGRFGGMTGAASGAPTPLAAYLDKGQGGLNPAYYGYVPADSGVSTSTMSLLLDGNNALGSEKALTGQFFYGTFATTTSTTTNFRPTIRLNQPPYTVLAQSNPVSSHTGMFGMAAAQVSIAATSSRVGVPLQFQWVSSGSPIVGPWFGLYVRAFSPDIAAGASYHTLDFRGGQSLRVMARDLQQASNTTLSYYFSLVRSLQSGQKRVILVLNSGVNDRNDSAPSVGAHPAPSNTPAGYADNLRALVNRIESIWTLNNWSQEELYFVSIPSHAVSTPEDTQLMSYRAAAQAVSDTHPRMAVVDMNQIATETEMTAYGWYLAPTDHYHLNRTGYETLSTRIINALTGKSRNPTINVALPSACLDC